MKGKQSCKIATAGWSIPRFVIDQFPSDGSGLSRYAARFDAVEINSTFYRNHRASTYDRWVAATPPHFRFAVKLPKTITHAARLVGAKPLLFTFRSEISRLGAKLGPLLIQLPPSLMYDHDSAERFLAELRSLWPDPIVCEPRHLSWFEAGPDKLLRNYQIGRVAADPACCPAAGVPGGWRGISYWRLHGSPRKYYSSYDTPTLRSLADTIRASPSDLTWCVFDNTASGAAAADAMHLIEMTAPELSS